MEEIDEDFVLPNEVFCDFIATDQINSHISHEVIELCTNNTTERNEIEETTNDVQILDAENMFNNGDEDDDEFTGEGTSQTAPEGVLEPYNAEIVGSCNDTIETPDGAMYYIPDVPDYEKPVKHAEFETFEDARKMYEDYAQKSGFSIRLSIIKRKQGEITHRYIVCNKAGKSNKMSQDSLEVGVEKIAKRCSSFKVTNCLARVKFDVNPGTEIYRVYDFVEAHNHPLLEVENQDLSKSRRQLQFTEQQFIHRLSMSNIGPSVSYRISVLLAGGHNQVRGTVTEYRNFRRDMNIFIGDRDAQMLVNKMAKRKLHVPNYSFDCKCIGNELVGLFWADEIAKINYKAFNDVLAFDATYRMNRYKMVFVPFTGVDHHGKSVILGGGLLKWENIASFKWLLNCFLVAHVKQPKLILTDQDGAMKVAIEATFTESHHRLCMWHIMNKLPIKISGDLLANTDIRKRLHKIVWNTTLLPFEFEERWKSVIEEFKLHDNNWLHQIFEIRHRWAPAYFKDIPMCCLMKTTSRAESSNSFFRIYSNIENSLVQFMMCFETAMEAQRYTTRKLDHKSKDTTPKFLTELPIEKFAAGVYCHEIFKKVQRQIYKGLYSCSTISVESEDGKHVRNVLDKDRISQVVSVFKVVIHTEDLQMKCSCLLFERIGWICRHIFFVLKDLAIDVIPNNYVLSRWRRNVLPHDILKKPQVIHSENEEIDSMISEGVSIVDSCFSRLRGDSAKMALFLEKLKEMKSAIFREVPVEPIQNRKEEVLRHY